MSMMPTYLYKAIAKHFKSLNLGIPVYLPEEQRKGDERETRVDVLIRGPKITVSDSRIYRYTVICVLAISNQDKNLYVAQGYVGQLEDAFTSIDVIGDGQVSLDCLTIDGSVSKIDADYIGVLSPNEPVSRYTVGAVYVYGP